MRLRKGKRVFFKSTTCEEVTVWAFTFSMTARLLPFGVYVASARTSAPAHNSYSVFFEGSGSLKRTSDFSDITSDSSDITMGSSISTSDFSDVFWTLGALEDATASSFIAPDMSGGPWLLGVHFFGTPPWPDRPWPGKARLGRASNGRCGGCGGASAFARTCVRSRLGARHQMRKTTQQQSAKYLRCSLTPGISEAGEVQGEVGAASKPARGWSKTLGP
mmetsp:Transcript_8571/g.25515  ORF Transcript_8571/g.25515 Transcript_8571/m.25515 type:complete len:219 (-) Transcript_8571:28-684(-)